MMEVNEFNLMEEKELEETSGGSLASGIVIGIAVVLVMSAVAETFNGYQEAKRGA